MTASTGVARGQAVTEGSHGDKATGTRPRAGRRGHLGTRGHLRTRGQRAGRRGGDMGTPGNTWRGHGDTLRGHWSPGHQGQGHSGFWGCPGAAGGHPRVRGASPGVSPNPAQIWGGGTPRHWGSPMGAGGVQEPPKLPIVPKGTSSVPKPPRSPVLMSPQAPPLGWEHPRVMGSTHRCRGAPMGAGGHPQALRVSSSP